MGVSDEGSSTATCFDKWIIPDTIDRPTTKNADCSEEEHKNNYTGFSE